MQVQPLEWRSLTEDRWPNYGRESTRRAFPFHSKVGRSRELMLGTVKQVLPDYLPLLAPTSGTLWHTERASSDLLLALLAEIESVAGTTLHKRVSVAKAAFYPSHFYPLFSELLMCTHRGCLFRIKRTLSVCPMGTEISGSSASNQFWPFCSWFRFTFRNSACSSLVTSYLSMVNSSRLQRAKAPHRWSRQR